jgi:hypothetical protein
MKILHLSFHKGCIEDFKMVCNHFNLDLTTVNMGGTNYNIGNQRAKELWDKNKDFYNSFDMVVTSDTAPLSRIFLQNDFQKELVVWICNRFDYADQATNDCRFPDAEYYQLFNRALSNNKVHIISYTEFEYIYARSKGVNLSSKTIKPIGNLLWGTSTIQNKNEKFFIPQYHNDTILMDLEAQCNSLGIGCYRGRYNGPNDLKDFKGIIHIPYAWSNLALFENLRNELVYFIPSKNLLTTFSQNRNFFWSPPFDISNIEAAEWYHPDYKDCFVYFDSWQDLQNKIRETNYEEKKNKIRNIIAAHTENYLSKWKSILVK